MSRIFVHGDIHGVIGFREFVHLCKRSLPKDLTKEDYVVVLGDFGLLWSGIGDEITFLNELNTKPWTTLWIDGNHENFDLIRKYSTEYWNGGKVHFIRDSVIHLCRGQVFELGNKKIFTFGGAQSYDRSLRTYGKSIWEEEIPSESEFIDGKRNLNKHGFNVDYVFSHTCPRFLVHDLLMGGFEDWDITTEYLEDYVELMNFKGWYFGHWHLRDTLLDEKGRRYEALYNDLLELE